MTKKIIEVSSQAKLSIDKKAQEIANSKLKLRKLLKLNKINRGE